MVKSDKMEIVHIHYPANGRIKKCVPGERVGGWESEGGGAGMVGKLGPILQKRTLLWARKSDPKSNNGKIFEIHLIFESILPGSDGA